MYTLWYELYIRVIVGLLIKGICSMFAEKLGGQGRSRRCASQALTPDIRNTEFASLLILGSLCFRNGSFSFIVFISYRLLHLKSALMNLSQSKGRGK